MALKILVSILVIILVGSGAVFAQSPLEKLGIGKVSSAPGASITDLLSKKDKVIATYLQSAQEAASSLEKAATAFGIKNDVLGKLADIKSLQAGSLNNDNITKARQAIESVTGMLKQKMQGAQVLGAEPKKLFSDSIGNLTNSIQKAKGLVSEVGSLTDMAKGALGSASLQDKSKVGDILSLASTLGKNIPLDLNSYKSMLSLLLQYAKSKNINVPQIATSLLQ